MKRRDLLLKISKAAKVVGIDWEPVREGAEHTIYRIGSQKVSVPRHREINQLTAEGILKDTEEELGKGWWR
jgi:mRNA interferase HicA